MTGSKSLLLTPLQMYGEVMRVLIVLLMLALAVNTLRLLIGGACVEVLLPRPAADWRSGFIKLVGAVSVNMAVCLAVGVVMGKPSDAWLSAPMGDARDIYVAISWLLVVVFWAVLVVLTLIAALVMVAALLSRLGRRCLRDTDVADPVSWGQNWVFERGRDRYCVGVSNEEYLALQGFYSCGGGSGWALIAEHSGVDGVVLGWHWRDDNDPVWCGSQAAWFGFLPDSDSRESAADCGWRVVPDHTDSGRLARFLKQEFVRENEKQIKRQVVGVGAVTGEVPLYVEEDAERAQPSSTETF